MSDGTEVRARAHRLAAVHEPGSVLSDLVAGREVADIVRRRGMPLSRVLGTRSFYDMLLSDPLARIVCDGTACWAARGGRGAAGGVSAHCLGRCYEAPAQLAEARPGGSPRAALGAERHGIPATSLVESPIVFRYLFGERPDLKRLYALPSQDEVLARIEVSGLRGRGGAAYPTAAKWRAARLAVGAPKYVVANGDEGDPGSYVDRLLLEREPHAVLAGMHACAHAIGATRGIVFVRGEYPLAAERVRDAIEEAREAGVGVAGFEIEVHIGAGSYVCGEETALLRAIEGLRAEASPKPPYPAEAGLFGRPTVVQNVETLSVIPWVLETVLKPTTKAFSLSGALMAPGAVEAPFGMSLRELLEAGGGGAPKGRPWTMALVGGPMGTVIAEHEFDVALDPATMPGLGHGGVVVFDASIGPRALAEHLFAFAASESCGACAPCRLGTRMLARVGDEAGLRRLLDTIEMGSLCGFGQALPRPIRDLMRLFPGEVAAGDVARESQARGAGGDS